MKTLKSKRITVAIVVTVITALAVSQIAFAGYGDKSRSLKQKKQVIYNDVNRVQFQQKKVEQLQKQWCEQRKAEVKPVALHNELLKAKADLKREKSYLAADKKQLLAEHKQLINARSKAVREQRADLMAAKARLFAALFKVKPSNIVDAQTVVDASRQLKVRNAALKEAKRERNEDLLAINKDIRDVNGQNVLVLGAEDGAAKLQALALK